MYKCKLRGEVVSSYMKHNLFGKIVEDLAACELNINKNVTFEIQ